MKNPFLTSELVAVMLKYQCNLLIEKEFFKKQQNSNFDLTKSSKRGIVFMLERNGDER